MAERLHRYGWLRWIALAAAVVLLIVFLLAQRQSVQVSYAHTPSGPSIAEGSAGELSGATVPSVAAMTAKVKAAVLVRLPGSTAHWDEPEVAAVIGTKHILVAPPGLSKADQTKVSQVSGADITIVGTSVSGGIYQASPSTEDEWRSEFAVGDVTSALLTLIAGLDDKPKPDVPDTLQRRDATATELTKVDETAAVTTTSAFPSGSVRVVLLPQQAYGEPMVRYGPGLAALHPGTPIIVMYGGWVEYDGPDAAAFESVATASFYAQFGDRLSTYAYPQETVLGAYLGRVDAVRNAGIFDRPLPFTPFDPLRVTLPVLPWLFAACVLAFLALSLRGVRRRAPALTAGAPARLAALTSIAVELSLLTDHASDPSLTRAIAILGTARDGLGDPGIGKLLNEAAAELDEAAAKLPFTGWRPAEYLA